MTLTDFESVIGQIEDNVKKNCTAEALARVRVQPFVWYAFIEFCSLVKEARGRVRFARLACLL